MLADDDEQDEEDDKQMNEMEKYDLLIERKPKYESTIDPVKGIAWDHKRRMLLNKGAHTVIAHVLRAKSNVKLRKKKMKQHRRRRRRQRQQQQREYIGLWCLVM